jgi:hypothetical protein
MEDLMRRSRAVTLAALALVVFGFASPGTADPTTGTADASGPLYHRQLTFLAGLGSTEMCQEQT